MLGGRPVSRRSCSSATSSGAASSSTSAAAAARATGGHRPPLASAIRATSAPRATVPPSIPPPSTQPSELAAATFKGGLIFLTGTLNLKSNLHLVVEENSTILGSKGAIMVPPHNPQPPSHWYPEGGYQDYGHTHWADSLFYGDSVSNVSITGSGTIDGNGALKSGTPSAGFGCKMFGLVGSTNVTLRGLTTHAGGWFTILATDTDRLTSE